MFTGEHYVFLPYRPMKMVESSHLSDDADTVVEDAALDDPRSVQIPVSEG